MTTKTAAMFKITDSSDDSRCTLRLSSGEVIEYWRPSGGGYVREISESRPGNLGYQVSWSLAHSGSMMSCDASTPLVVLIRQALRSVDGRASMQGRIDSL